MNRKQTICMWIGIVAFVIASGVIRFHEVFRWWLVCIVITSGAIYTFRDKENERMNFFGKIVFSLLIIVTIMFAIDCIAENQLDSKQNNCYQILFGKIRHTRSHPSGEEGIVIAEPTERLVCLKLDTATGETWQYTSDIYGDDDKLTTTLKFEYVPTESRSLYYPGISSIVKRKIVTRKVKSREPLHLSDVIDINEFKSPDKKSKPSASLVDANTENHFIDNFEMLSLRTKVNKYIYTQAEDFNIPSTDEFIPNGEITDEREFEIYSIRTYRDQESGYGSFEIIKSGQCVFGYHGWIFDIGDVGIDLTGNGKHNAAIYEYTGGAHCCDDMYLLELGKEVKLVAIIRGDECKPIFEDIDGDSIPELVHNDPSYNYFPSSFVGSSFPKVILRWDENTFKVAVDLMRIPTPDIRALEKKAIDVKNKWISNVTNRWNPSHSPANDWGYIPKEYFGTALDLMYGGHEELGWNFLGMAWPERFPFDHELFEEFLSEMASSPYWMELKEKYFNFEN